MGLQEGAIFNSTERSLRRLLLQDRIELRTFRIQNRQAQQFLSCLSFHSRNERGVPIMELSHRQSRRQCGHIAQQKTRLTKSSYRRSKKHNNEARGKNHHVSLWFNHFFLNRMRPSFLRSAVDCTNFPRFAARSARSTAEHLSFQTSCSEPAVTPSANVSLVETSPSIHNFGIDDEAMRSASQSLAPRSKGMASEESTYERMCHAIETKPSRR